MISRLGRLVLSAAATLGAPCLGASPVARFVPGLTAPHPFETIRPAPAAFYAESMRRVSPGELAGPLFRPAIGSAFKIGERDGIVYLVGARHTTRFRPLDACGGGGLNAVSEALGIRVECVGVAIIDPQFDMFIFGARATSPADRARLESLPKLALSPCDPPIGHPLLTLGYPADVFRRGQATLTRSCRRLPDGAPLWRDSPAWSTEDAHDRRRINDQIAARRAAEAPDQNAAEDQIDAFVERTAFRHDCTTWAGNSGGPMLAEGTDVVVGVPFDYIEIYARVREGFALRAERASLFVQRHQAALRAYGARIDRRFCPYSESAG